jgi:hypothetical protein
MASSMWMLLKILYLHMHPLIGKIKNILPQGLSDNQKFEYFDLSINQICTIPEMDFFKVSKFNFFT